MSSKAARGTKRTCQGCGARFYDLNRDPIICPICGAEFQLSGAAAQAHALRAAEALEREDDDDTVLAQPDDVEVVSLEEAEAGDDDIPDIEGDDLDDLDADSNLKDDEDALMPDDDSEDDDVSGFLGGSLSEKQEDET